MSGWLVKQIKMIPTTIVIEKTPVLKAIARGARKRVAERKTKKIPPPT